MAKTEPVPLKTRAMRLLARREHSRLELARKLSRIAEEGDDIEVVLDELAQKGWLSDARYAEHSVRAKARRYGPLKVAHELRCKGIGEETIEAAFRAAGIDGAADMQRVWASRFSEKPTNERERARQVRFLQGRGFPFEPVIKFLRVIPDAAPAAMVRDPINSEVSA
ncbi:MAG TPA: recombination regulator RecX [Usitatibacter sp.]|nr:recombination regulator RecX [Usitatibacter sp.]